MTQTHDKGPFYLTNVNQGVQTEIYRSTEQSFFTQFLELTYGEGLGSVLLVL